MVTQMQATSRVWYTWTRGVEMEYAKMERMDCCGKIPMHMCGLCPKVRLCA